MVTISPEAHALAVAAIDIQQQLDADSRRLTSRIRTDINDPSVQLLLAEIVIRLDRIEARLAASAVAEEQARELQVH